MEATMNTSTFATQLGTSEFRRCAHLWFTKRNAYSEVKRGGRFAAFPLRPGDKIGRSVVGRCIMDDNRGLKVWEVTCEGCGKVQLRPTGALTTALRRRTQGVQCPECLRELRTSKFTIERSTFFTERVLEGGPIYTEWETEDICRDVMASLLNEFGPMVESITNEDLHIANGWPFSKSEQDACQAAKNAEKSRKRYKDRRDREELQRMEEEFQAARQRERYVELERAAQRAWEYDRAHRAAAGGKLVELMESIDEGDQEAMLEILEVLETMDVG